MDRLPDTELAAFKDLPWIKAGVTYTRWRAWVKFLWNEPMRPEDFEQVNSTARPFDEMEGVIKGYFGPSLL